MNRPGEFDRISLFLGAFRDAGGSVSSEHVPLGPGDDAAILRPTGDVVVTTDTLVEDVHFRRQWSTWEQIGARSVTVNLSDLAAMGATPLAFTCALVLPPTIDDAALAGLARGMAQAAKPWSVVLAGGNLSRGRELSITLAAFGTAGTHVLRRDAARPGDMVLLIGEIGTASAELGWLNQGRALPAGRSALLDPQPQIAAGLSAVRQGARCGIDVSDGLVQDLGHIAGASGIAIEIDDGAIPQSERFRMLTAEMTPAQRGHCLLGGGDDYALVVVGAPEIVKAVQAGSGGAVIGRVLTGSGVRVPGTPAGRDLRGHDHFGGTG